MKLGKKYDRYPLPLMPLIKNAQLKTRVILAEFVMRPGMDGCMKQPTFANYENI